MRTVQPVQLNDIPQNSNVISIHVLYEFKTLDDATLMKKALISPHGNEDSLKLDLKSDCSIFSPVFMRILVSAASIFGYRLSKLDVKSAFLLTGLSAICLCYPSPRKWLPRPMPLDAFICRILTFEFQRKVAGAVGQNSFGHWLCQSPLILQLFFIVQNSCVIVIFSKIIDDLLLASTLHITYSLNEWISQQFMLGTITTVTSTLRYFGQNIFQSDDYGISVDAEDKLDSLNSLPLSIIRRQQLYIPLNTIYPKDFASLNSSVSLLGITASTFCADFSSRLQKHAPTAIVKTFLSQNLCTQSASAYWLYSLVPSIPRSLRPPAQHTSLLRYWASVRSWATVLYLRFPCCQDMSRCLFHVLYWSSHRAKLPVRSICATEILSAGESIDEGEILTWIVSAIYSTYIPLIVSVDSKDIFT